MQCSTKSVSHFKSDNKIPPMERRLLEIANSNAFRVGQYSRSDGDSELENTGDTCDMPIKQISMCLFMAFHRI